MPASKTYALRVSTVVAVLLPAVFSTVSLQAQDVIPPSAPTSLLAKAATCGQIDLSWNAATDEAGGSGMKGYVIHRNDLVDTTISAGRTAFSDTIYVAASTTLTYTVNAMDNAGNKSPASNPMTVTTPACATAGQVIDNANEEPLGKAIATYGSRTAVLYRKQNVTLNLDTWIYLRDDSTGQSSRFMLHSYPGYYQTETDYVFTSATELWTLSYDSSYYGGKVLASQYRLNGSPIPTSATLVSTKSLGDANSKAMSMIRLKSGALMIAWNQNTFSYRVANLTTGYAYRNAAGNWTVNFPVTFPNSYGIVMSAMAMAQHPADNSIWAFVKRDSFSEISALHFTENAAGFTLDWIKTDYISSAVDGANGPEGEFPALAAAPDPTRNSILLAYESNHDQPIFVDALYGSGNSIFLKQTFAAVAQIGATGSKTFIPFETPMERCSQFGFSVGPDGAIWLTYQPINSQTLTWNEVYSRSYFNNTWSSPTLVGYNYNTYNVASGIRDPGLLVYRLDEPEVAFLTPDLKIHSIVLSGGTTPVSDTVDPTTVITSPTNGATISGVVTVQATASDNSGVSQVDLLVDGVVKASKSAAPFNLLWDTASSGTGNHTLQTVARDAAGNVGYSAQVGVIVSATTLADTIAPLVAIISPGDGSVVNRNSSVVITATATDNVGVSKVEFYVSGKIIATATGLPYTATWQVPTRGKGSYSITVVAYDAAGNNATATSTVNAN